MPVNVGKQVSNAQSGETSVGGRADARMVPVLHDIGFRFMGTLQTLIFVAVASLLAVTFCGNQAAEVGATLLVASVNQPG